MPTDARLANTLILTLAAMRAKKNQVNAPRKTVTVQIVYYDTLGLQEDELGASYTYELPPQPGGTP